MGFLDIEKCYAILAFTLNINYIKMSVMNVRRIGGASEEPLKICKYKSYEYNTAQ